MIRFIPLVLTSSKILLAIPFAGILMTSCIQRENQVHVTLKQFQVPVLKYRQNNPVLQIKLVVPENVASEKVSSFTISADGTDDLADIMAIRLFYMGRDSMWIRYEDTPEKAGNILDPIPSDDFRPIQFGEEMPPASEITFRDEQMLEPGDNYFWVMYELSDMADLHHTADAGCNKIKLDKGGFISPELSSPPVVQRIGVALRQPMDENVDTYRIPGLATTNKGTLLALYDARHESSRDLQGDIDIVVNRSTDGGNTWEPNRLVLDMGEWGGLPRKFNGVSDPCIVVDENSEKIFIAGLWMHGLLDTAGRWIEGLTDESTFWEHQWRRKGSQPGFGVKQTSQFLISESTDDGQSWSPPVNLTHMCKKLEWWLWAPAPGRGITADDGTLVMPTQGRDAEGRAFSNITYSKDGGITWKTSNPAYSGTNECSVVQLSDGTLMLNMRYRPPRGEKTGRIIAVTDDLGDTWTEHPTSRTVLPEPVCMGSLHKHIYIEGGERKSVLLFSNPNVDKNPRSRITIKASFDDGLTWPDKFWLLLDEGYGRGYSCLTSIDEKTIGIVYEGSQADMIFESIPLNEIIK